MKKKLTRNIGLKILSVLLAVILWIVITNVDDPVKSKSFPNIPVKILNENIINTPNQSYEILEGETIDIKVAAKRSIIEGLSASDFQVTADFAELNQSDLVYIDVIYKKNGNDVSITYGEHETMKISREQLSEEDFKVNVVQKGEIVDGYYIGEKTASPNIIRVSGPKSRIEKIKEVVVEMDVTDKARSYNDIAEPMALDEEGKEIDATRLTFSEKYIAVNLKVYKTKTVNLQVRASGNPAEGYILTGLDFQPETVTIAAEDDILEKISYLLVVEDISGASQNIEKEINLQDALPEGAIIVGEDDTAVVNITIEQLETKEISIWPNDIEIRNKSDSLDVLYITKGPIKVNVRGPIKEIKDMQRTTLSPYIDLTGYQAGTYLVQLNADISDNSELFDTPMVNLNLVHTY